MAIVTDLVTKFSFSGSANPLNRYNSSLARGIGLLAGLSASFITSGVAVSKWTSNILQAFNATAQLSRQSEVAVEWLQEMGYVASVNGSNVQALEATVDSLSKKIGDAAQRGSTDFARLGISVRDAAGQVKSADVILDEVGRSFRRLGLSIQEQKTFAAALGIDASLIQTLNLTNAQLADFRENARELGVLTQEQSDQVIRYNDSLTTMRFGLNGLQQLIAVGLAPQLEAMAGWFTELLKNNRDWIVDGVKYGMDLLADFLAMLHRLLPVFGLMGAGLVAMKVATMGFTGALAALFSPAIVIAAGIAALLLVVDDLIVAFHGGESVIRNFFLTFFDYDIQGALEFVVREFQAFLRTLKNLFTGNFKEAFDDLFASFSFLLDGLANMFRSVFGGIFGWIRSSVSSIIPDWLKNFIGIEETSAPQAFSDPSFQPGGMPMMQTFGGTSVEQTVNMEIRTSDPERAGRAAADNLQRQMSDAQTQARRGGL